MKRKAVSLYCMGLSLNAIGKRLGVLAQSAMRWVRDHARDHCPKPQPTSRATVVELDEIWHFIQKN
jgi:transposase-like protein